MSRNKGKNNWQNDFEIANFITFRIPVIVVHLQDWNHRFHNQMMINQRYSSIFKSEEAQVL